MLEFLLRLVYPQKCLLCGEIITYGTEGFFCGDCLPKIALKEGGYIYESYESNKFELAINRAVLPYDKNVSKMIYKFKYGKRLEYGRGLGQLMAKRYKNLFGDTAIDCVMPVPLHKKRYVNRGFNQAQLLASEVAVSLCVPLVCKALSRVVDTKPQSALGSEERVKNVKDAFRYNKRINIENNNILLIDDIFTTGSTMSACAKLLIKNGAANVYGYTLAIVCDE